MIDWTAGGGAAGELDALQDAGGGGRDGAGVQPGDTQAAQGAACLSGAAGGSFREGRLGTGRVAGAEDGQGVAGRGSDETGVGPAGAVSVVGAIGAIGANREDECVICFDGAMTHLVSGRQQLTNCTMSWCKFRPSHVRSVSRTSLTSLLPRPR